MRVDILTLFPEMLEFMLSQSIIGRAQKSGVLQFGFHNIRDYTEDKHRRVDDYPYGGGNGMVMQAEPIYNCYKKITDDLGTIPKVIYMSPQGKVLTQEMANAFSKEQSLIVLCGHYEGVDERALELIGAEEVSIGDYVLTGGELAALVFCDAVTRLVPGVLKAEESYMNESHQKGLLEYPQYTRPEEYMGLKVPEILLSGHHVNIEKWRYEQSVERTKHKRPDMYEKYINNDKPQEV